MPFHGQNVVAESVSAVTATPSVELGTKRTVSGNDYIYVYNTGANAQISPGQGCVLTATSGYSVSVSSVAGNDVMIGICKHATITTGTYGWVLTKGFCSFVAGANDSFTAGGPIAAGVDGTFGFKSSATGFTGPVVGKCMISSPSGGSAGLGYFSFY